MLRVSNWTIHDFPFPRHSDLGLVEYCVLAGHGIQDLLTQPLDLPTSFQQHPNFPTMSGLPCCWIPYASMWRFLHWYTLAHPRMMTPEFFTSMPLIELPKA